MIIGHGVDIVDLRRFQHMTEERINRLSLKILTSRESEDYETLSSSEKCMYLAKTWASKEAVSKAFGTGIRGSVTWKNIQVIKNNQGQPRVNFINGLTCSLICHLSISHDKNYLIASTILEEL
jgi:holo-[acyl-carrier protein] synthase